MFPDCPNNLSEICTAADTAIVAFSDISSTITAVAHAVLVMSTGFAGLRIISLMRRSI